MELALASLALLAGGLLAVQAVANLQLGKATGNPLTASTLQLGVGTILLLALAAPAGALGALDPTPHAAWWHWSGGLGSAVYVTAAILLFPRLGAVVSVGLFIAGQMLASLALDGLGLLGIRPTQLGEGDALGALMVVGGAALIVRAQAAVGAAPAAARPTGRPGWVLLGVAAGAALPIQGAVNAQLRVDLGAPLAVGVISFAVATLTMTLVLLAVVAAGRAPGLRLGSLAYLPWWGWLGGICGAVYVTAVFTAIPAIGAAAVVGLTVAGQQVASVFFDRYGLMRLPRRPVTAPRLTGVGLLLVGVALIQLA